MSGAKEIRGKIASIKNTQKITKAMEMVAASKMRKAQDRMQETRPYAQKIQNVISHLAHAHPEYHHPYLQEREARRVGLIIISTDRGLCGGLNINLFKSAITSMKQWDAAGLDLDLTLPAPFRFHLSRVWAGPRVRMQLTAYNGTTPSEPLVFDVYRDEAWTPIGAGTKSSAGAVVYRVVER